jgi:hypothetical protein
LDNIVYKNKESSREMQESLLDQALEETFPASDPISPMCPLSVN